MFSVNNISVVFSGEELFSGISFNINSRDRIGLVGRNGAGKTTLLRIIAGQMQAETGNISMPDGYTIGYLPQELESRSEKSVFEEALTAFSELIEVQNKLQKLRIELETDNVHDETYLNKVEQLIKYEDRLAVSGAGKMEAETEKVLTGLGFEKREFDNSMSTFSGGWQMRVHLAKLLLRKPELLLLDEPTNHLDIVAIQWLEEFLSSYPGAVVLVSHDRAFLDKVTNRTIEISLGKIFDYKASYSAYVALREERKIQQQAAMENQQKQIEQIEKFIERFRYKASKARQVQSRVKMLEKMDVLQMDESDNSAMHFSFPRAPQAGKVVLDVRRTSKSYGVKNVFSDATFALLKGEKIAFVGKNGEGKTTMARMIMNQTGFEGEIIHGYNVSIGYYAQNHAEFLDPDKTVFQTIDDIATGDVRLKIRQLLGSFLFSGEAIDKKVKVLSGGEKSRLALVTLLLRPVNLLILDEPTNHLDMLSKDILKNALLRYDGALIVVSHDRDFLQGLTSKVIEFRSGRVKEYLGDVYDFLESRRLSDLNELNKISAMRSATLSESRSNNDYEQRKAVERTRRKILNTIKKCENEISMAENNISETERHLNDAENYKEQIVSGELYRQYEALKAQLNQLLEKWEQLHQSLEDAGEISESESDEINGGKNE